MQEDYGQQPSFPTENPASRRDQAHRRSASAAEPPHAYERHRRAERTPEQPAPQPRRIAASRTSRSAYIVRQGVANSAAPEQPADVTPAEAASAEAAPIERAPVQQPAPFQVESAYFAGMPMETMQPYAAMPVQSAVEQPCVPPSAQPESPAPQELDKVQQAASRLAKRVQNGIHHAGERLHSAAHAEKKPSAHDQADVPSAVSRGKSAHGKRRFYVRKWLGMNWRVTLIAVLSVVMVVSLINVGGYLMDLYKSREVSAALREAYYAELAAEKSVPTPVPTSAPAPTPILPPQATPLPTPTTAVMLERIAYPGNASASVRSRFAKVQRQNADIIGWLTIDNVLDEAVVQRDNSYYLRRDYRGYHNDNGAIFLEESIALNKGRPYTMMLYGHNMRSGAMFGCLRNYENINYYRKNAFLTFDTAYEDGNYVIFAVGTLSQTPGSRNYVNVSQLMSSRIAWRTEGIAALEKTSVIASKVDVKPDDQLLLLITCVDDDEERRYVAARRLREGESEEWMLQLVEKSKSK